MMLWNTAVVLEPFQRLWAQGVVAHSCNSWTWEVHKGGSGLQSCPQLHSGFRASLDFLHHCLKMKVGIDGGTEQTEDHIGY